MIKSYIFGKNPDKLLEMLSLRAGGMTFTYLADLYTCDRTSIRYQCRKYKIFPTKTIYTHNSNEVFDPQRISHNIIIEIYPTEPVKWVEVDGERVNAGRTYADYLKQVSPYINVTN